MIPVIDIVKQTNWHNDLLTQTRTHKQTHTRTHRISESKETLCVNRKQHTMSRSVSRVPEGPMHLNQVPSSVYFPVYWLACLLVWVFSFGPLSQYLPVDRVALAWLHRSFLATGCHWKSSEYQPREVWWSPASGALFGNHAGLGFSYFWSNGAASCTSTVFNCKKYLFSTYAFIAKSNNTISKDFL